MYRDLGFKRVILGRETPLDDIAAIKAAVPEMELEVFVHGAMCLAYSGRCFLSSYMADRSANQGDCTHSCRWMYRVLEEKQRPGEFFPIIESEEGYTSILSSKDLCMFDHLDQLKDAGVDSIKIEGRMKSLYYTAVVTRSYRKALDQLENRSRDGGAGPQSIVPYRDELFKISRREYSTGFFFGKRDADKTTSTSYAREYTFLGTVGRQVEPGWFELHVKNQIRAGQELEFIGPEVLFTKDVEYQLYNQNGETVQQADHGKEYFIRPSVPVEQGYIIRAVT